MFTFANRPRLPAMLVVCAAVFSLFAAAARADRAAPKPPPVNPKPAPPQIILTADETAKEAHLKIPLSALKAAVQPAPRSDAGMSPAHTVVAGVSLSAALVLSGLLLVRGRGRGRSLMLAGLIAGGGVLASIATADVPRPRPAPGPIVVPAGGLSFPVVVEVVDDGPVRLIVPGASVQIPPPPKPKRVEN